MSQILFSPDWVRQFSDPYAVLGLSVTADDRRVLKRYRTVAKLLHPDSYARADAESRDFASQIFARLVNPAYQKLKQETGRADQMATLRFQARQMKPEDALAPRSDVARQLLRIPPESVDIVYEQTVTSLAESQYQPIAQFAVITEQLEELNLIYLRLKVGGLLREKPTGIVPIEDVKPILDIEPNPPAEPIKVDYAQRHYQRAQEYMKKSNWSLAVQELRDAIRTDANRSEYHALLAKAYLMQNLPGMATVHFKQALKLNPQDPLALEYAKKLKISLDSTPKSTTNNKGNGPKPGGLFGLFAKKR